MAAQLRQRPVALEDELPAPELAPSLGDKSSKPDVAHPSGKRKKSQLTQWLRGLSFVAYFLSCCVAYAMPSTISRSLSSSLLTPVCCCVCCLSVRWLTRFPRSSINITQFIGAPLYVISRDVYYAYMALTKESFGLLITTMTKIWGPTTIRISGDHSVAGQIKRTRDGRVHFSFPERIVMIANHQIYTDWLYLWWVGYANSPQMHGYIYIILKESLKYIPVIGTGMMFYGFIFMSRKMAVDQPRMAYRLNKLRTAHTAPDGTSFLNPMWLLLFPEGTNLSDNGRVKSARWAEKAGVKDCKHQLLPRSTGMYFVLKELKGSVEYVYDCTIAYEGIP